MPRGPLTSLRLPAMPVWTKTFLAKKFPHRKDLDVGAHTYGKLDIRGAKSGLKIGRYCSIATGVTVFLGAGHRPDFVTTYPFSALDTWPTAKGLPGHPHTNGPVTIGNDVWLGNGSTILSGITIGDGAVIGAGAMVTKDVAPYAIHAGNPAKFIRYRFEAPVIEALRALEWWHWPDEKVARAVADLMSADISNFITRAQGGTYDAPP